jgi:hypothetical protein
MEGALHTALQALLQSLAVALPLSARLRRACTALTAGRCATLDML